MKNEEEKKQEDPKSEPQQLGDLEPIDTGENPCPPGYKWSAALKKCVADPG